jgi:hypothetical protein
MRCMRRRMHLNEADEVDEVDEVDVWANSV